MGGIQSYIDSYIFHPPEIQPVIEDEGVEHVFETYSSSFNSDVGSNQIHMAIYYPPNANANANTNKRKTLGRERQVIVYSHGNASDVEDTFSLGKRISEESGLITVFYDYFGYGHSYSYSSKSIFTRGDKPSEAGCYASLEMVMNYLLVKGVQKENILLVGQSLGTGVVVDFAYKKLWGAPIILISPYTSIVSIISESSYLKYFIDQFRTENKISYLRCPVKIYHGTEDKLIDVSHSHVLELLTSDKTFSPTFYEDVGHNNILEEINFENFGDYLLLY